MFAARNFFGVLTTIWMKPIKFNSEANMKIINRFKVLSFFLIAAYLLAACGSTLPSSTASAKGPKVDASMVAFTGIVEAINGTRWTVSGQTLTLDPQVSLDPNIKVGDRVKVEANVSADGSVVALKVESPASNDAVSTPSAEANSTPDPVGTFSADVSSTPDVSSTTDPASTQAAGSAQNEIFGAVEAMTTDTITVNGVTYNLAQGFTEIKDIVAVGDQVKLHVIPNADGTFTVREIEKSAATTVDDQSGNSNGSDDGPNHDVNDDNSSSSNSNGSDDGPNHDSNDDNGGSGGNSGPGGG
jgi:uncharacterized protein DUF5666